MPSQPRVIAAFLTEEGVRELTPYRLLRRLLVSETVLLCRSAGEHGGFLTLEAYEGACDGITEASETVMLSVPHRYVSCLLEDPPERDLIGFQTGNAKEA
ncbi:MAG TPA: hypothetical protein VK002_07085 [Rubricoccaceae bacterium]|nr:hypothetical protein [Rubricoccaceae bacterium]